MDTDETKRLWREKNTRESKGIAVDIEGVGQVFVRPIKVRDGDLIERIAKSDGDDSKAVIMAGLLCDENGKRFPPNEVREWEEIFADASWADYVKVTNAATGKADASPN